MKKLQELEAEKKAEKLNELTNYHDNLSINSPYNNNLNNFGNQGNSKIKNKHTREVCNKIIDIFENKKSTNIVDNFLNDYKIILNEINNIYEKDKIIETFKNDVIYVAKENSNDPHIAFKIVDQFQCFLDVLIESCRYYDYIPVNYMLRGNNNNNNINLTQPVKSFLEKNPDEKIFCLYEKSDNEKDLEYAENWIKNQPNYKESNLKMLDKADNIENNLNNELEENYDDKIKILDDELINIEDNLISKLCKILLYLIFLCIIFVYYMDKFQIQQRYFIDEAVKSQIFEYSFYGMNKLGLDNSFSNLGNSGDLEKWFFDAFTNIFSYSNYYFIFNKFKIIKIIYFFKK